MAETIRIAVPRPSEVRLSPTGDRLYSADPDGFVRIYDTQTGFLIESWDIGQKLGGMDISPDGTFLLIVDRDIPVVYRVDTATGTTTSYSYSTATYEGLLFDVAVLSNGTALFSQDYQGSGSVSLKVLDLETGVFTAGAYVSQTSILSRTAGGDYVLIGEPNSSAAPLDIYQAGTGIIAQTYAGGYNWGIQAFSGSLAAQYIYNEGIHIYDADLQRQVTLTAWNNGVVTDLAFSPDGQWLYVLENVSNSIVVISTTDWTSRAVVAVDADVGAWLGQLGATYGSRLIVDPGLRYLSVVTDSGLVLVDFPLGPPINGTNAADFLQGSLFADTINGMAGDDILTGGLGIDTLTGGDGRDTFRDTLAGLNGDTITDFGVGDMIVFSDADPATFEFSLTDSMLTYSGGWLTLLGTIDGLAASAAAGGGVQLIHSAAVAAGVGAQSIVQQEPGNDFNSDGRSNLPGRSDLPLRSDGGFISACRGADSGGFPHTSANLHASTTVLPKARIDVGLGSLEWNQAVTANGRDDILWRNDNGTITQWLGQANGGFADNQADVFTPVPTDWQIQAPDLLWV